MLELQEVCRLEELVADLQNTRDDTTSSELRAMLDDELLKAQNQLQQLARVTAQLKERELLEKDLTLLEGTLPQLSDEEIRASITAVIEKCQQRIAQLSGQTTKEGDKTTGAADAVPASADQHVTLTNYAWDQSNKFIKLHVSVPGLHKSDASKVSCSFTVAGLDLRIKNLKNKSYKFVVNNLANNISPSNSRHKVKDGTVLLLLCKEAPDLQWRAVNAVEDQKLKQNDAGAENLSESSKKSAQSLRDAKSSLNSKDEAALHCNNSRIYLVKDRASAIEMLNTMDTAPPKILELIKDGEDQVDDVYRSILTRLANISCNVFVTFMVDVLEAAPNAKELIPADLLLDKSFSLHEFIGRLNAENIVRLPSTIEIVGLSITSAAEATAVAAMTPRRKLCVCVSKLVDIKDLKPLPATLITDQDPYEASDAYHLYFRMVSDEDVAWIIQCIDKLVAKRNFRMDLWFTELSLAGVVSLTQALAEYNIAELNIDAPRILPFLKGSLQCFVTGIKQCPIKWFKTSDELRSYLASTKNTRL